MSNVVVDVQFLYSWQRDCIRAIIEDKEQGEYHIIKSLRQSTGKTFTLLNLLGLVAVTRPGSISMLVSPTFGQSQRCLEDLGNAFIDWVKIVSRGNCIVDFSNGSRIYFKSAEQGNSLRGFTIKGGGILACDEASFISNEVFEILLPVVNKRKATVVMTSTPDKTTGMFYSLYNRGLQNDHRIHSYNWSKYINEVYSKEELEFYKSIYSDRRFKTEILGEFVADGGSVFLNVENCLISEPGDRNKDLYFGIDWGTGSGNDYTVVTALNEDKEMVFQKAFNDMAPLDQIKYITELIKEYGPRKVLVEKNSIGSIYFDALKQNNTCLIEAFTTSNESKCRIVDQLCAHFEKGKIKILNDEELLTQLRGFEESTTKSGLRTYSCPSPLHDDRVLSLCFALEAIESGTGSYSLGSSSFRNKNSHYKYKSIRKKYE